MFKFAKFKNCGYTKIGFRFNATSVPTDGINYTVFYLKFTEINKKKQTNSIRCEKSEVHLLPGINFAI
jgi:hypothetical protein